MFVWFEVLLSKNVFVGFWFSVVFSFNCFVFVGFQDQKHGFLLGNINQFYSVLKKHYKHVV